MTPFSLVGNKHGCYSGTLHLREFLQKLPSLNAKEEQFLLSPVIETTHLSRAKFSLIPDDCIRFTSEHCVQKDPIKFV